MGRGNFFDKPNKLPVIRARHIRETGSELFVIRTDQRIRDHIDVIAYDHQVTDFETRIDTACGIGNQQILNTQELHHPDGEGHLLHGIALIIMETSLHGKHLLPS